MEDTMLGAIDAPESGGLETEATDFVDFEDLDFLSSDAFSDGDDSEDEDEDIFGLDELNLGAEEREFAVLDR